MPVIWTITGLSRVSAKCARGLPAEQIEKLLAASSVAGPPTNVQFMVKDSKHLTATLPSQVEFIRTFGVGNVEPIAPSGNLGTAQRQIQFLPGSTDEAQREFAKGLIHDVKACIITPSVADAER